MKGRIIFVVALIMVVVVLSAGSLSVLTSGSSESRKVLVLRTVGHELLRSSGDSTSRVLPVRKMDDQTYLIEFANQFSFVPDSLVSIVQRAFSMTDFPAQYTVHVLECSRQDIVYGYEIQGTDNLIPCTGRTQPRGCYAVQITFSKPLVPYSQSYTLFSMLGMGLMLGLVVIGFRRKATRKIPIITLEEQHFIAIGHYQFYPAQGLLRHPTETVELSRKETTLLKLFAENANMLLLRDRLLKEVWEDEGVITGRSLDMFVSKLRKKLHHDPNVKLVNVHGKGYRLETSH